MVVVSLLVARRVITATLSRSTPERRYPERADEFRIAPPACVTT
jgi:hypothetical protein